MPSSVHESRMCSTAVKPVPSSKVEKSLRAMVLPRAEGALILRPPSSNGCNSRCEVLIIASGIIGLGIFVRNLQMILLVWSAFS